MESSNVNIPQKKTNISYKDYFILKLKSASIPIKKK